MRVRLILPIALAVAIAAALSLGTLAVGLVSTPPRDDPALRDCIGVDTMLPGFEKLTVTELRQKYAHCLGDRGAPKAQAYRMPGRPELPCVNPGQRPWDSSGSALYVAELEEYAICLEDIIDKGRTFIPPTGTLATEKPDIDIECTIADSAPGRDRLRYVIKDYQVMGGPEDRPPRSPPEHPARWRTLVAGFGLFAAARFQDHPPMSAEMLILDRLSGKFLRWSLDGADPRYLSLSSAVLQNGICKMTAPL